jgi:hypothetical protein
MCWGYMQKKYNWQSGAHEQMRRKTFDDWTPERDELPGGIRQLVSSPTPVMRNPGEKWEGMVAILPGDSKEMLEKGGCLPRFVEEAERRLRSKLRGGFRRVGEPPMESRVNLVSYTIDILNPFTPIRRPAVSMDVHPVAPSTNWRVHCVLSKGSNGTGFNRDPRTRR